MYVDKYADNHSREPEFELQTFYGQLNHIYVVHFANGCHALRLPSQSTLIMAQIHSCVITDQRVSGLDIHFYT